MLYGIITAFGVLISNETISETSIAVFDQPPARTPDRPSSTR